MKIERDKELPEDTLGQKIMLITFATLGGAALFTAGGYLAFVNFITDWRFRNATGEDLTDPTTPVYFYPFLIGCAVIGAVSGFGFLMKVLSGKE